MQQMKKLSYNDNHLFPLPSKSGLTVGCDFDGTVTLTDVLNKVMRQYGGDGWMELEKLWARKQIGSAECMTRGFELLEIGPAEIDEIISTIEIDPHFSEFTEMVTSAGHGLVLLSDGMDYYIRKLLEINGLDHIQVCANRLIYENGRFITEYPYTSTTCGKCANCKGGQIKLLQEKGNRVIFIGDGLSDRCAMGVADVLFAKEGEDLARCCREEGFDYLPFKGFADIIDQWDGIIEDLLVTTS